MARRHRGRILAVLTAALLVVVACSPGEGSTPTTTDLPESSQTTTASTSTTVPAVTTMPPTTTSTFPQPPTTSGELPDLDAEIRVPDGEGPFPAVVLVHGGGWVSGEPSMMNNLARFLTAAGFLTINAPYQLSLELPGFPQAVDDIACAVNFGRAHPDSDGTVALIGHSAGAHISALVALTGDSYADDCPVGGDGLPDRFVGLAGPYDVDRLGLLMLPFFGGGPTSLPDAWLAGNPQRLTAENPDLSSLIMYGDSDGIVQDGFAINFFRALEDSGSDTLLEVVEGARHQDMRDPDWVGDLIVTWLQR